MFSEYLPIDLAIIRNHVEIVEILAPFTKKFELIGMLLDEEIHEQSWECFEVIDRNSEKGKNFGDQNYAKRPRIEFDCYL